MKKNVQAMLIFILSAAGTSFAGAANLHVGPSRQFATIRDALAKARNGDSILVYGGIWSEGNLVIDKEIKMKGINNPVLDGKLSVEMISVKASHVTITGFTLINSAKSDLEDYAAVKVYNKEDVLITNNILKNNFFGVYLSNCSGCTVTENRITSEDKNQHRSGNGIHLWHCNHIQVKNNTVKGHRDGIYFEFVTASEISGNTSEGNIRYGLHFMFSNDDTYTGNTFRNNGAGVAVMFSYQVRMIRNTFEQNWGASAYGILLKEIKDSEIRDNKFDKNTAAITMEGATRIKISQNTFSSNGWAIRISGSSDQCSVNGNNFLGNTFDVATSGSSVSNNFDGNYWDKYIGYDLNRDGKGDTPFYPVNLSSLITERIPCSLLLQHSFTLDLIDQSEKIAPQIIPMNICDFHPVLKKF
ncbi:MAG: nitrous oxide reductase family maturation protein NosD [Bacteroidia bacterium]